MLLTHASNVIGTRLSRRKDGRAGKVRQHLFTKNFLLTFIPQRHRLEKLIDNQNEHQPSNPDKTELDEMLNVCSSFF
jgi:hypothetical protein